MNTREGCPLLNMVLPKIDVAASSQNYGHFVVSPLESGYGITLGNALRRVLLSSLLALPLHQFGLVVFIMNFRRFPMFGKI